MQLKHESYFWVNMAVYIYTMNGFTFGHVRGVYTCWHSCHTTTHKNLHKSYWHNWHTCVGPFTVLIACLKSMIHAAFLISTGTCFQIWAPWYFKCFACLLLYRNWASTLYCPRCRTDRYWEITFTKHINFITVHQFGQVFSHASHWSEK